MKPDCLTATMIRNEHRLKTPVHLKVTDLGLKSLKPINSENGIIS
jgi:hypothetical protein